MRLPRLLRNVCSSTQSNYARLYWIHRKQCLHTSRAQNDESKSPLQSVDLSTVALDKIRNFSIIAHIDHGEFIPLIPLTHLK